MTDNKELSAVQASLNETEAKLAVLRRKEREGIEAARTLNANVRLAQAQIRALDEEAAALKQALREESQRRAAEQAKAAEEAAQPLVE
jgi:hypothetical protein